MKNKIILKNNIFKAYVKNQLNDYQRFEVACVESLLSILQSKGSYYALTLS